MSGGDAQGIRDIELKADAGEIIGLLGPNGAGKSTLLRALAMLLRPSAGTLRLFGAPGWPPHPATRRRIGYAADEPVHLDALSGRENALFFAQAAGLDAAAAAGAVSSLLARLDLATRAEDAAGEYSQGMRRKLLLLEALAHGPELLLLDEPTAGLDLSAQATLCDVLRERVADGTAVLLATHDLGLAERLCDRVVFLHHGSVVLQGGPADLVRRCGAATRIDVRTAGSEPTVPKIDGVETALVEPGRLAVRATGGAAVLPRLCTLLLENGHTIRSVMIHEPGLADVFFEASGVELGRDGMGGTDDSPGRNVASPSPGWPGAASRGERP